jgi:uncharacterized YccA/Bax inhibitor family protein
MTKASVTLATLFLLALVVTGAVFGWQNVASVVRWWWAIMIGLIALALTAVFVPRLAPIVGVIYSVASGALLGAVSKEFETLYDGIVFLALTATVVVFVVALTLYVTGVIKVTQRFRATFFVAACGIGLLYLATWVMSWFGINVPLVTGAGPAAIAFSLFVIVIVSLGLMLDFDMIDRGIAAGAPRGFSWFAAFGLITSIVWVYIEIMRLLAILAWRSR